MKEMLGKVREIDGKVLGLLGVAIVIIGLGVYALWELVHPHLFR
jgi:hypothetical protein